MVRRRSHRRAISRHQRAQKTKRRQDLRSRRWRHPKTGIDLLICKQEMNMDELING